MRRIPPATAKSRIAPLINGQGKDLGGSDRITGEGFGVAVGDATDVGV